MFVQLLKRLMIWGLVSCYLFSGNIGCAADAGEPIEVEISTAFIHVDPKQPEDLADIEFMLKLKFAHSQGRDAVQLTEVGLYKDQFAANRQITPLNCMFENGNGPQISGSTPTTAILINSGTTNKELESYCWQKRLVGIGLKSKNCDCKIYQTIEVLIVCGAPPVA